jgi:8-amino-7-oxononanoate synthase
MTALIGVRSLDRVAAAVAARQDAGLHRVLRPRALNDGVLDLASNDYLGLARDPRVMIAAADAAVTWGAGSTGSRLVTGTTTVHTELEDALAVFTGAARALVFSSGYLANLGVITALGGPDVTIVSDTSNHASLVDACRLARSPVVITPHGDADAVELALAACATPHALVVTDAVFSVDGDLAPIAALHQLCRAHGALLVVDEAHSLGVVGEGGVGAVAAAGLGAEPDVIRTITLSKSLGSQGGAVLAAPEVVELLISTARSFIFDTGLAPAAVSAALRALQVLVAEPWRAADVRSSAWALAELLSSLDLETVTPDAAVGPAFVADPGRAAAAADACLAAGVRVGCFRPPSVPAGASCLRLTARADLTSADLVRARRALESALSVRLPLGSRSGPGR